MNSPRYQPKHFDISDFDKNRAALQLTLSHHHLRYLNQLYSAFNSDLALVIVLGEIAHHNASQAYTSQDSYDEEALARFKESEGPWDKMPGCNAHSLSEATGIPRETVRRKVQQLVKQGWVCKTVEGDIRITPSVAEHFGKDFNPQQLDQLLTTAQALNAILSTTEQNR